ncbi:MAG: phosphotransferase [Alphaproteobacteria bacterium]|nr:phosphotransferase [Alphaproteobacteria bacterium]
MSAFLEAQGWGELTPVPLAGDASFRRYFRLRGNARRAVVMDAPPPHEDVRPYTAVAALLLELGFSAPEVFAMDAGNGFLLIEDFGDDTYTRLLDRGAGEGVLYALAVDTLIALQRAVARCGAPDLQRYDAERLLAEAALLVDWYAPAALGSPLSERVREEYLGIWRAVLAHAFLPTETLVLRDYHVGNLMLLPDRPGVRRCGILDFQDAVVGPASYDLVSLIRDARRDVPAGLRDAMIERYFAAFPSLDRPAFLRSAAMLAAQRNCKILGIFTRLWKRDGKPAYLGHIPRIWRLLDEDLAHPDLAPVKRWLDRHLPRKARIIPDARNWR